MLLSFKVASVELIKKDLSIKWVTQNMASDRV